MREVRRDHPARGQRGPWEVSRTWNGSRDPSNPDDWPRLCWSWEAVEQTHHLLNPHDDPAIDVYIIGDVMEPLA